LVERPRPEGVGLFGGDDLGDAERIEGYESKIAELERKVG
jgi:hypothetical protein